MCFYSLWSHFSPTSSIELAQLSSNDGINWARPCKMICLEGRRDSPWTRWTKRLEMQHKHDNGVKYQTILVYVISLFISRFPFFQTFLLLFSRFFILAILNFHQTGGNFNYFSSSDTLLHLSPHLITHLFLILHSVIGVF